MKKTMWIGLLLALAVPLWLTGCQSSPTAPGAEPSPSEPAHTQYALATG